MSRIARTFIRRVGAPMLAGPALVVGAGPASADGYARFDDAVVTVSPDCTGTVSAEAAVAPLQIGDRVENGVRVSVQFAADNHDSSCFVVASVSWHNLDTGATGGEDITVASTADLAGGGHYGDAGYNRANFFAGSGTIVVTVSTNPHPSEVQITV
jgi:hypothetical protein